MTIEKWLSDVYYDVFGTHIWNREDKDGGSQLVADIRGWGRIQNEFKTEEEAAKFQDEVGEFIVQAIREKIERTLSSKNYEENNEYTTVNWGGVIQKIPKKGSGELEQINQDNPVTRGSTALVRVTSSQTISDEEIEKESYIKFPILTYSVMEGHDDLNRHLRDSWVEGIKWYREQLKKH